MQIREELLTPKEAILEHLGQTVKEFIGDLERGKLFTYQDTLAKLASLESVYHDYLIGPRTSWQIMLREAGFYSILTKELIDQLEKELRLRKLVGLPTIEVCSGRAALSFHLRQKGIPITPIDDTSDGTTSNKTPLTEVDRGVNHLQALNKYRPKVVIGAWIPYKPQIGIDILNFPSVDYFIDIGETASNSTWLTKDYENRNFKLMDLANIGRKSIWIADFFFRTEKGNLGFQQHSEARFWKRKGAPLGLDHRFD